MTVKLTYREAISILSFQFSDIRDRFLGSPSFLGIAEFIVPTGTFFHAQTHVLIPHYRRAFPKSEGEPIFAWQNLLLLRWVEEKKPEHWYSYQLLNMRLLFAHSIFSCAKSDTKTDLNQHTYITV